MPLSGDTSLLFGAAFGDSAPVGFGERAPESGGFEIAAVSRCSWLLAPGVVQDSTVDRVEAEIVDEAEHSCPGARRIAVDGESNPPARSPRNPLLEKAPGEDVVERLDHGMPDLLRDPLAVDHAPVYLIDVAIAKLGMIVAGIDYDDAARHVGKQPPRKIGDGLRWDRKDDDFSGFGGVDNGSGRRAELGRQRDQAPRSSRARNRDVMTEPGEVARKYPSHADSHVNSHLALGMLELLSLRADAVSGRR